MVDVNGIPQVIEMTLINPKKFKIKNTKTKRNYPIKGLDFKNRKRGPDIKLILINNFFKIITFFKIRVN